MAPTLKNVTFTRKEIEKKIQNYIWNLFFWNDPIRIDLAAEIIKLHQYNLLWMIKFYPYLANEGLSIIFFKG